MEKLWNFILKLFVCVSLLQGVLAGIVTEKYYKDSVHYGKCVINEYVLSPGQSIKHPELDCARFTCETSLGLATIETCDHVDSPLSQLEHYDPKNPPNCVWTNMIYEQSEYPKCCSRNYSCIFNNTNTQPI